MKKTSFILMVVGLLLGMVAQSGPAYAISYDLTNWNETNLDASTDKVTVDVTTSSGFTTLVFTWVSGNSGLTAIGMDKIGYDSTVGCCGLGTTSGWGPFGGSGNEDGFGSFLQTGMKPAANDLAITLKLTGDASLALNGPEDFALHIRYGNDCSGFISGRSSNDPSTNSACGSVHQVPEPTSLLLLGSGLAGMGLWGRKKYKNING